METTTKKIVEENRRAANSVRVSPSEILDALPGVVYSNKPTNAPNNNALDGAQVVRENEEKRLRESLKETKGEISVDEALVKAEEARDAAISKGSSAEEATVLFNSTLDSLLGTTPPTESNTEEVVTVKADAPVAKRVSNKKPKKVVKKTTETEDATEEFDTTELEAKMETEVETAPEEQEEVTYSCEMEELLVEIREHTEDDKSCDLLEQTVSNYVFYYATESALDRLMKRLGDNKSFPKRMLKALKKQADIVSAVLGESLLAHKLYPKLTFSSLVESLEAEEEVEVQAELGYLAAITPLESFELENCLYQSEEDLDNETLLLILADVHLIETKSRIGKKIETCLKSYAKDNSIFYVPRIRECMLKHVLDLVSPEQFKEDIKPFRRKINTTHFNRYKTEVGDADFIDYVGNLLLTHTTPEILMEHLDVTQEDVDYLEKVLKLSEKKPAYIDVIKDDIDFIELEEVTEEQEVNTEDRTNPYDK